MGFRETPRLLVIDPDALSLEIIRITFSDEGCDVVSATSYDDVGHILQSKDFDLLLIDYGTDNDKALELIQKLHSANMFPDLPIAVISSRTDQQSVANCLNSGAADFIHKPFFTKELSARVWNHIGLRKAMQRLERHEMELQELNNQLKLDKEDREKLLSIMAHDLKNPILGISGLLTEITDHFENYSRNQQKEFLVELRDSSLKVRDLLLNLVDWAKSQTHGEGIRLTEVNLFHLVDQVAVILEGFFLQKSIRFHTKLEVFSLSSDADILAAVLRNLLTNAVKFTPQGGAVELRSRKIKDQFFLEVQDTGVGMSPDTAAELMSFSRRVTTKGTGGEAGTGLGLKLSHDLIQKLGGTLSLRSEMGIGTTFTICLPKSPSRLRPQEFT